MQFARKNSLQACVSLSSSGNVTKKEGSPTTPLSVTVNFFLASNCFPRAVLGGKGVAQGIKRVHVIHEEPKEPGLTTQWTEAGDQVEGRDD